MTWCTEALPNVCNIHYTHVLNVMQYGFGGRADESCPGANFELQHLFPWDDQGGKRKWVVAWALEGCLEFSDCFWARLREYVRAQSVLKDTSFSNNINNHLIINSLGPTKCQVIIGPRNKKLHQPPKNPQVSKRERE